MNVNQWLVQILGPCKPRAATLENGGSITIFDFYVDCRRAHRTSPPEPKSLDDACDIKQLEEELCVGENCYQLIGQQAIFNNVRSARQISNRLYPVRSLQLDSEIGRSLTSRNLEGPRHLS